MSMATTNRPHISAATPEVQLLKVLLGLMLLALASAQDTTTSSNSSTTSASSIKSTTTSSKIISLFYIDENAYSGLPYSQVHNAYGEVIGVDDNATTYIFTTTRILKPTTTTSSITDILFTTSNIEAGSTMITLTVPSTKATAFPVPGAKTVVGELAATTSATESDSGSGSTSQNGVSLPPVSYNSISDQAPATSDITGTASTITQGPKTFEFTGILQGAGPNHTVINRCQLKKHTAANCTITHIGNEWYATMAEWDGVSSTRTYSWTEGDRMGYAPVTMTAGLEMMRDDGGQDDGENGASVAGNGGVLGRFGAALVGLLAAAAIML